nr:hypothetical protein [Aneurinibacillus sp. XH2]
MKGKVHNITYISLVIALWVAVIYSIFSTYSNNKDHKAYYQQLMEQNEKSEKTIDGISKSKDRLDQLIGEFELKIK